MLLNLFSGNEKILMQAKRLLRVVLSEKVYGKLRHVFQVTVTVFENYVVGQTTEAIILGSICYIGMKILRLDYAGMISIVVGITALIPILGAYIGGVRARVFCCVCVDKRVGC